ncbi:restriction endonuclease subunit S [uncultured Desulfovibrio sp.]|uniref:restriction endonuclease subunit S n=1 Tax=uncultured Desulfovibrio sp. TaxID=167968 RepID=UPI00265CF838|nr:restriction endonuclease subunit S [uncultured Desulfovibrio sp.]
MTIKEASLFCKDGDWIESKDQSLSGIRLIQTGNIGVGVYLDKFSRAKYISEETFNKLECTEVFPGDIIISRLPTPVGRACIVPDGLGRTIAAVDCTILRINEKKFLKEYVLLYTETGQYKSQIEKFLAGSTRVRISRKNLESISIPQKNLETQKNIVSIIYKIKNIVELRKQQLSKLDQLVKSRFIEMFGDPTLNIKMWDIYTLGKRCQIITGNTPSRTEKDNYGDFIEWIKSNNINKNEMYISKADEFLSLKGFSKGRYVESGSLLMTCIAGSINRIGNIAISDRRVAFNQQINAIIPKVDNKFYIYWLIRLSQKNIHTVINHSLKGILNKSQLSAIKFPFPPIPLQEQFATFVQQVEKAKSSVKKSLEKLETLKKSLMQEYFE